MRPGVGLHVELGGGFSLGIAAGFRWVFNKGGQFHDVFFPQSSVNGVDGQAKVGYRITPMFEVRAIVDWRRYFSSMNCFGGLDAGGNAINDVRCRQFTAGGAIDQYFSGSLAVAMTMGGTEITGGEAEEPPPPPKRKRKVRAKTRSRRWATRSAGATTSSTAPARSSTWTWTRSTRPSSSATTLPCAGGR